MRTTFRRQFTLMACLILSTMLVFGIAFNFLIYRHTLDSMETSLRSTAKSVSQLASAYNSTARLAGDWDFQMNLSFAAGISDVDLVVCDPSGRVISCANDIQGCTHLGQCLSSSAVEKIPEQEDYVGSSFVSEIYDGTQRVAVAVPVHSAKGTLIGIVVASAESTRALTSVRQTGSYFTWSAIIVMLLTILGVSYITRKQTQPLKTMATAARQLGHGNFSVRVPVAEDNTSEFNELSVAFNNMAASLEQSESKRKEFIANISHELKTPMTTIAGFMDGMLDGTIPKELHPQYMMIISEEVRRLSRLVRSMLDIAQLQDQPIPEERKSRFDLCEAVGIVLLSFERRIEEKQLQVDVDLPSTPLWVRADKDSITQVIYNLTDNAVKFCNAGGTLRLHAEAHGGKAYFSVRNSGLPIPASELPLIFDRFHKTDKSRSVDRDGVGLGLYIVKTIIDSHGEDLRVVSQEGMTEFTFTLPAVKPEAKKGGARDGRSDPDGSGRNAGGKTAAEAADGGELL